jgi:TonB family protein
MACATLWPDPRGCPREVLEAAEIQDVCPDARDRFYLERLINALNAQIYEIGPRPYENAHLLMRFGDQGVSQVCVDKASTARFARQLEAALVSVQERYRTAPPVCAVGARYSYLLGVARVEYPAARCESAVTGSPPRRVSSVPPAFPIDAALTRREGWVHLKFAIRPDGSVTDVEVVKSDPPGVFDEAAKTALNQWRYCPEVPGRLEYTEPAETVIRFEVE